MSDPAIHLSGVGKMYKLFADRNDNLFDALGLPHFGSARAKRYREFWALRGIDLKLERGKRIGIIGRNGAGKTTLLKLITGNLEPTEGSLAVNGTVHALMDAGAGFHPEFNGYENIRSALAYQGLSKHAMRDAIDDIAEFTELGDFLQQPMKTYSLGMQARLAFATATTVRPEVLVIDEILGAGDAYFVAKSLERIHELTSSGASMLIVSHSMAQITQLCEHAIWLDRGRIVTSGPSLEVVRSYEGHIRELDDRRIQERNAKRQAGTATGALDQPELSLEIRVKTSGQSKAAIDVSEVVLVRDGRRTDVIEVGAPQDIEPSKGAFVVLDGSSWSAPLEINGRYARGLSSNGHKHAAGSVIFNLLHLDSSTRYEVDIEYRRDDDVTGIVEARNGTRIEEVGKLAGIPGDWHRARLRVPLAVDNTPAMREGQADLSHWPGEGSLRIRGVVLSNASGQPCAVFEPGDDLRVEIGFEPAETDTYEFLPAVVIYRLDGVNISTQIGHWTTLSLRSGGRYRITMTLGNLNLGNGTYLASPVLYKVFDQYLVEAPVVYDWIDRGIEFQVVGTPPAINSVFQHPSAWRIDES